MASNTDLYTILMVKRDASQEEIKRAFRKLAMEYHPDRNQADEAESRFKEISAAYDVLSDPDKRTRYDRFGMDAVNGGGQHGFSGSDGVGGFGDIFDAFFRGTTTRRSGPQRGSDRRATLTISFEDAVSGAEREIEFERTARCEECRGSGAAPGTRSVDCPECGGKGEIHRVQESLFGRFMNSALCARCGGDGEVVSDPCNVCRGRGITKSTVKRVVNVPAGVDEDQQVRLNGAGDAGLRGGPAGNLYLDIEIAPHEQFTRRGDHLVYNLPLNPAQAALGTAVEVPMIEGEPVLLEVPPGTQPGAVFTINARGVPHLQRSGRGDLLVQAYVVTPTKLSNEQRELLERLSDSLGTPALPEEDADAGLIERIREAFS